MVDHKRPDTIPGYTPPQGLGTYCNRNTRGYKTFTEGEKVQGEETFNSTTTDAQYATHTIDSDEEESDTGKCPVCKGNAVVTLPNVYSTKTCSRGHSWYTDRTGEVKMGNP